MQRTTNYNFKKPDYTDFADIKDLNDNFDAIDEELAEPSGNLEKATVETSTTASDEYPVPVAGDSLKVIVGKIAKFFADIVKTFTGATSSAAGHKGLVPAPAANQQNRYLRADGTWQELVNDHTTTTAGKALDARQANPNVSGSLGAQLKSLNDSFNNGFYTGQLTAGTDLNSLLSPARYTLVTSGNYVNCPVAVNGILEVISAYDSDSTSVRKIQRITTDKGMYIRSYPLTPGEWGEWGYYTANPQTALFVNTTITATPKTLTLSSSFRALLCISSSSQAASGLYLVWTNASGAWGSETINESTLLTITSSTSNRVTLSVSSGSVFAYFIVISGTISE